MSFPEKNDTPTPHSQSHLVRTMRLEGDEVLSQSNSATKAFLNVIRSNADLGTHVFIEGPTVLGRDPTCTVPLQDFGVSRQHAVITPQGDGSYVLQDLKSTNGTRVNGTPIPERRVLKDGEKIYVGDTVLRFALADEIDIDFHSEVATLVSTDPLTGLPSKRRFDQAFEFSLQAAVQGSSPLSLLMMDMDGLKKINDTHGHLFGAFAIGETGRLIARVIGFKGHACRFGGDEFSAFLPAHDQASAIEVAEEIRQAVESAGLTKDGILLEPTISIGLACYPAAGSDLIELVATADKALYRAKAQGKNCVAT